MKWSVSLTAEVDQWFLALADSDGVMADRVEAAINVLADTGPSLGRPLVDKISASRHHNMKELRIGSIRILFAFDPLSEAFCCSLGTKLVLGPNGTCKIFRSPTGDSMSIWKH